MSYSLKLIMFLLYAGSVYAMDKSTPNTTTGPVVIRLVESKEESRQTPKSMQAADNFFIDRPSGSQKYPGPRVVKLPNGSFYIAHI